MKCFRFPPILGLAALLLSSTQALCDDASSWLTKVAEKSAALEAAGDKVLIGNDGWLFFSGELRSVSVGPFWGDAARTVSRAARPQLADPLPAILEFNQQCKDAGVELVLMPVPPKAIIYPEHLSADLAPAAADAPRSDTHLQAFYSQLREAGVNVLDLTDIFIGKKDAANPLLYCKHDTHWSGYACEVAAAEIHRQFADRPWVAEIAKQGITDKVAELSIKGDLWSYLKEREPETETLKLRYVGTPRDGQDAIPLPLKSDRKSPILLIGDSHTLVFNAAGDLHAMGAGLPDQLAMQFGAAIDLVGVRGAGTTVPRIDLARRKDNLKDKKLVIWCFSARQFTESVNGWMTGVPVVKK